MLRRKEVVFCGAVLALIACSCWASVQYPVVTSCQSEPSLVTLQNLSIEDAKVGRNMTIHYIGELHEVLQGAPITKFTMWNSNGLKMPCVQDMGSCTYKGCDGESAMEKSIGEPWNNTCPIPAGVYSSRMVFFVHPVIKAVLANGTFKVRMEVTSGDRKVQCRLLDVHIEK
ncbi:hypothetical protein HPB49_012533 [Dermacentor silvarum]|uniref:Uncharacterized protein n=1 Tax=Dermacentor silvarum TaxID=543639 RepID=A0ACB8C3L4_DERSI|nr:uncharacterized protein LOC119464922 [Dermacentor silvarum]KAH7933437.1 hypothetical protein HPB49_012533 [Dermacentor silvarum]